MRILRAVAAPLRARPAADVRRRHVAAASAVASGATTAPASRSARARRRLALPRPVLAGGLALSLVAGLVAAAVVVPEGLLTRGSDEQFEIAMEFGFTPSPVPFERAEEHVIVTVAADRADEVSEELTRLLAADPTVLSVRTDRTTFTVPASVAAQLDDGTGADGSVELVADTPVRSTATPVTQAPVPSWGLDRIDAGVDDDPLDGRYRYLSAGSGVTVYVIDTGVRSDHADLGGRVLPGWSAIEDGRGTEDCNGHGTHVAGTVAGTAFGVAKGARIVPIRVLDCNGAGFASSVVSGISWVIANHPGGPGVINLSLGGPANSAIDRAVADAAARGLTVVAAAGNEGGDACAVSPARSSSAVTTGATTSRDARAGYSNFGPCVDLFAPGSGITSAWHTGPGASATLSGTSMAAPHVAGIAARLLEVEPGAGPARITALLTGSATSGAVSGSDGSANLLLNLIDFEEPVDCELLEEQGAELPEECLDEDAREDDDEGLEDDERDEERDGDGEGRQDAPPGLGGILPPGFGGAVPGLERAPGLDGRTPPGLVDGTPPGLVRDVPRTNGLSIDRAGEALTATWRVAGEADAFVLECTAARPGPTWSTDLTVRLAAEAVSRSGDRVSVGLAASADAMTRCRIAAEVGGVLGVRSNAAPVPAAADDDDEETPEAGPEQARPAVPGGAVPAVPGPPADAGRPAAPGGAVPGGAVPAVPGPPADAGRPAAPGGAAPGGAAPAAPGSSAPAAPGRPAAPSAPSTPGGATPAAPGGAAPAAPGGAAPAVPGPPASAGPPASVPAGPPIQNPSADAAQGRSGAAQPSAPNANGSSNANTGPNAARGGRPTR